jgi:hypothetical protein
MSETLHDFTESDWKLLQDGRITFNAPGTQLTRSGLKFNFSLRLKERLLRDNRFPFGDLILSNCVFTAEVAIGPYNCAGNVTFINCLFQSAVRIELRDNVKFEGDCIFKHGLTIMNFDRVTDLANITIDGQLWIAGNSGASLRLSNITIKKQTNKQTTFLGVNFPSVHITKCCFENIQFTGLTDVEGDITIDNSKLSTIDFFAMKAGGAFRIVNSEVEQIFMRDKNRIGERFIIEGSTIGKISLPLSSIHEFEISDSKIEQLEFVGYTEKDSVAIVQRNTISKMLLNSIHNEGQLSFREVQIPKGGGIEIKSSNLGKTDFILCNFEKAQFEFQSSKMTEIFVSETEFPTTVISNGQENHRQSQLAFGQISAAFQKQGDTVRSLEYQAREIEAHYKHLSYYHKRERKLSFTKISLWLNKWSNDFGRSWQRGILFSIVTGMIFFYLLVVTSKTYHVGFPVTIDNKLFVSFLRFMNPLRFFDLEGMFKLDSDRPFLYLSEWSYLWDFLGRVFVAYGFYQTIQAFRRYGRK